MIPDLIFDVGAHNGDDSFYYLSKGFRVVAVEANGDLCAFLRSRFGREASTGRFILVEAAIADKAGEAGFWVK